MRSSMQLAEGSPCAPWRRYLRRLAWASVVGCVAATALPPATFAAAPATTSRQAKEEAVAEIPFDRLKKETQVKLLEVLEKPSIYRRLPEKAIACDPDMYLFLVRYPEVVVNIWELMGVTNVQLKRVGDYTFECSDGAGTVGTVELVYGSQDLHVLYAEATYEGTLTGRKLNGRGVLILKSQYKKDRQENPIVDNRLDVFLQIDQAGAEIIAKTLQPLVGKSADINFEESATFISRVSQASESNGPGMQRLAAKLKNVPPDVQKQFAEIAALVNERAMLRHAEAGIAELPPSTAQPRNVKQPQRR